MLPIADWPRLGPCSASRPILPGFYNKFGPLRRLKPKVGLRIERGTWTWSSACGPRSNECNAIY